MENWNLNIEYLYREIFDQEEFQSEESHIPIFWKDDRDKNILKLKDEAVQMLTNYRKKDYNHNSEVILSEAKFTVKEVQEQVLPAMDREFLDRLDCDTEEELNDRLREALEPGF